ncbi:rho-related BTB domain-containing protein 2-like [Dreissena polymorpha]|uniref:BTB domain-containing protein n=1 Tax=Dreissena polymorpha TaxID=45954 RepID=A0A9D4LF47_DREPO|nr:rho-related BTB domain-containing protein 2-like [Dreissena polymorpha]KAH3855821.1 hypothetical protein DPMN_098391 [Dreissena polymorpha]
MEPIYDVEESQTFHRKRTVSEVSYSARMLNDYIKCVVIGDSGVGKTCLISSWACNTSYSLEQLVKTHVSTVWAHDHYRKDANILNGSMVQIDGGYVALRLWDTFGYHDKDRSFAYRGADVILLCFSVAKAQSLINLKKIWLPEIRRLAPTTPIVIVGCQADLRYLYREERYKRVQKGLIYKVVTENDILIPDQGRKIAKDIGVPYYECSAYTTYGIEDVFLNVIRVAIIEKRKLRFFSSLLPHMQYPQLQAPMRPPPLQMPKVEIPVETLHQELSSSLLNGSDGDVVFVVHGQCFYAHQICLAISAQVFEDLFIAQDFVRMENVPSALKRSRSSQSYDMMYLNSSNSVCGISNSCFEAEDIQNKNFIVNFAKKTNCPFLKVEMNQSVENQLKPGKISHYTVVTMRNEITERAFQIILDFLYAGIIPSDPDSFPEVCVACGFLQLSYLTIAISNVKENEEYLNLEVMKKFQEQRTHKLRELAVRWERLTDVRFLLDDGAVRAHKPLLMGRCEMMYAMFNANFIEADADSIFLPGLSCDVFRALREYLYTGSCPAGATLNCLGIIEAANRFCIPRLVAMVEGAVVSDLTEADKEGEDIIEDVLRLLEPAQLHNASQLADWCKTYLCNQFLAIRQKYMKPFLKLSPENIRFIERNRWPPEWYLKEEKRYYEGMQTQAKSRQSKRKGQLKHQFFGFDQSSSGCLCFCSNSKRAVEEREKDGFDWSEEEIN